MIDQKLTEYPLNNLEQFVTRLKEHRYWHLIPKDESDISKSIGVFDIEKKSIYPSIKELKNFLAQHSFIYIENLESDQPLAILQSATRLLWNNEASTKTHSVKGSKRVLEKQNWAELSGWTVPNQEQLKVFSTAKNNPFQKGPKYRLATASNTTSHAWLTTEGQCDVDKGCWKILSNEVAYIFACHMLWEKSSSTAILTHIAARGWRLRSAFDGAYFEPSPINISIAELSDLWAKEGIHLRNHESNKSALQPVCASSEHDLSLIDYTPCRLPPLDRARLTDPEQGLWELWGTEAAEPKHVGVVARNPEHDVRRQAVAIDFGTSSTVVAMDSSSGARELLRIGVRDFRDPIKPAHFENPTMLECLDFKAFAAAWSDCAYRPALDWNWMRAAHEAQASFRDNPGDTGVLARILPRLKQWAFRSSEQRRVVMTDAKGHEVELPTHTERNPVRGQRLAVSNADSFDPVELYAWYLGMAINWRGRGLFLKYYLSFPVKYERGVKERILASFRRGLQRSLPATLVEHHQQVLNEFEVNDLASEPAAYAAAALPHLGIEPTDEGVPYAVFDFGGGTSDFDFGLLRWATAVEETKGYEQVFEHLASSGDNALGGENLLEHLVYESFKHNLEALRKERIQFTLPLQAPAFAGSEAFLAPTQAAQTNTIMLAAKLRPFLEGDGTKLDSPIKLDLIDANSQKKTCELVLDAKALDALLFQRIRGGVEAFLAELAKLRSELPANAPIQLLLAGNGCRSRHIQALFDCEAPLWCELLTAAFGESPPSIVIHKPLPMDADNPYAPTTKTGVALGLLNLVPGENTLQLNHLKLRHDGQAPFAWFAGRLRRKRFEPTLAPGAAYQEWTELGPLQEGVFNLFVTTSPRAHTGLPEGHPELKKHRLDFPAAPADAVLFARATGPHTLEMAAAADATALEDCTVMGLLLE